MLGICMALGLASNLYKFHGRAGASLYFVRLFFIIFFLKAIFWPLAWLHFATTGLASNLYKFLANKSWHVGLSSIRFKALVNCS